MTVFEKEKAIGDLMNAVLQTLNEWYTQYAPQTPMSRRMTGSCMRCIRETMRIILPISSDRQIRQDGWRCRRTLNG